MIEIALAGNPNSGKSTLFNAITGDSLEVGNWAGVTVEKRAGTARANSGITIVDLPGIYAMSAHSEEEKITENYLTSEAPPDLIINVVDAVNMERNLFLTTQLFELGIPIVIALNRTDMVSEKNMPDISALRRLLRTPIVPVSALKGSGIDKLLDEAAAEAEKKRAPVPLCRFPEAIEKAAAEIQGILRCGRHAALKLIERGLYHSFGGDEREKTDVDDVIYRCVRLRGGSVSKAMISARYGYIRNIMSRVAVSGRDLSKDTLSDRIDRIALGRYTAVPLFAAVIGLIYFISVILIGNPVSEWLSGEVLVKISAVTENLLLSLGVKAFFIRLICSGIISGVGGVLCFLPQLSVLLFFMGLLEDCGYMSRIAFSADRLMRYLGLSGKSVISLLLGSGCSVPGILSGRTIENSSERNITIVTTPFIPCSAKLTVIIFLAGIAATDFKGITMLLVYIVCIASVAVTAFIFSRFVLKNDYDSCFIMELPDYKLPSVKNTLKYTLHKIRGFIFKAFTVIFIACIIIWLLSNYNTSLKPAELDDSVLAEVGKIISPVFEPLGWGNWMMVSAMLCGLIAKENIIGTLGILSSGAGGIDIILGEIGFAGTVSYLIFNLLCIPCAASVAAMRKELGGKKFTVAVVYQSLYAYAAAYAVYHALIIAESGGISSAAPFMLIIMLALSGVLILGRALRPEHNTKSL